MRSKRNFEELQSQMNEELKKKVQFIKEKARRDLENIQRHASEKNFALKRMFNSCIVLEGIRQIWDDLALLKEEKQSLKSVKNQLQKENEKLTSEKLKLSRDLRIAEDKRRQIICSFKIWLRGQELFEHAIWRKNRR